MMRNGLLLQHVLKKNAGTSDEEDESVDQRSAEVEEPTTKMCNTEKKCSFVCLKLLEGHKKVQ